MVVQKYVLHMAILGAAAGFLLLPALILYEETATFRDRLEHRFVDDVPRSDVPALYAGFLRRRLRVYDRRATLKAVVGATAAGALTFAALAVWFVGAYHVVN